MFKDLRQGSPVYIIHKGDKPISKIGSVISVSNPVAKFPNNYSILPQELVVDLKVKIGDETANFEKLPANSVIADLLTQDNKPFVISSNKDAINAEIETMLRQSKEILNSVGFHESAIQGYERILTELNPIFAKEKQQEEEIASLKNQIENMSKTFTSQFEDFKQLLINNKKEEVVVNNNNLTNKK